MTTTNNKAEIMDSIVKMEAELEVLRAKAEKLNSAEPLPELIKIPDRGYSMSKTHITVEQYELFCKETSRTMPDQPKPHDPRNPVVNVTWHDANAYCEWLSKRLNADIRLPSEDEWEHCCGDHTEANPDIAVYGQNHITQVATKKPNKFGLYDMLGLAWTWTSSAYE